MTSFYAVVLMAGIAISGFLINSYNSFSNFHSSADQLINYQTATLSSANRVAKESSEFLHQLKVSLAEDPFPTSLRSSGQAPTPQDDVHTPVEALEELISDLELHTNNQLNTTISYGLEGNKKYKYELLHSDYIPPLLKEDDPKYISTILSNKKDNEDYNIKNKKIKDLDKFIKNNKLNISETLLKQLFGSEKVADINSRQDELGLNIGNEGLELDNLPNAIKLFLEKDSIHKEQCAHGDCHDSRGESRNEADKKFISQLAVAQLRAEALDEVMVVDPPDIQCTSFDEFGKCCTPGINCNCTERADCSAGNNGGSKASEITVNKLDLALSLVPFSERGFLFDPNTVIDQNNPLQIINKKEGGYTEIFKRNDGYLQISIGSIATKLGPATSLIPYFENAELSFDTVVLSFEKTISTKEGDFNKEPKLIVNKEDRIELDLAPRGRTTYTATDQEFKVNGITIPKSSIIVAVKKAGVYERSPELKDYKHFRVYDPNTGDYITHFGEKARNKISCSGGTKNCMDIKKFKQEKGTSSHGQDIFFSFSLEDLMPNETPLEAAKNWSNIQKDLELKLQADLNADKAEWLKDELKELNKNLDTYTGNDEIDNLTINDTQKIKELLDEYNSSGLNALKKALNIDSNLGYFDRTKYSIAEINEINLLNKKKNDALAVFALNKLENMAMQNSEKTIDKSDLNSKKKEVKVAKTDFIKALDDYNLTRKTAEKSTQQLSKSELENLLKDSKLPAELRTKYQDELEKLKAKEAGEKEKKKQAKLEKQRNEIKAKIKSLTSERNKLANDLKTLEAQKADLKKEKSYLENTPKKEVKNKGKKLDKLKKDIKTVNNKIENKKNSIKDLDKKIDNQHKKLVKLG